MTLKTLTARSVLTACMGIMLFTPFLGTMAHAQYYQQGGYPAPSGYDPYANGGYAPQGGGYNSYPSHGYPQQGGYNPTGYNSQPANNSYGYNAYQPQPYGQQANTGYSTGYDPYAANNGYNGGGAPQSGGYYPQDPGYNSGYNPGYNPSNGADPGYGYNPSNTGYTDPNTSGGYSPYDASGGYNNYGAPSDSASFGGSTTYNTTTGATSGTSMLAWSPSTVGVQGLKYSYHSQFGDYAQIQAKNIGRWDQFPITMHLTYPEHLSSDQKDMIKDAIGTWQKYVDIELVENPAQAKIELTWVSELTEDSEYGNTEFLMSHVDSMGRTIADKAVIRMLDPSKYGNVYSTTLKAALMHQVGHSLGINTHSDNEHDLMAEPHFKKVKNQMVKKAVRSLAAKTLGQFLDLSIAEPSNDDKPKGPPVDKISKRDLNTLHRLYN